MLIKYFKVTETEEKSYCWVLTDHDYEKVPITELAQTLADRIVRHRCRGYPELYDIWKNCSTDGTSAPTKSRLALNAFLIPAFGNKGEPNSVAKDHLEGYIGEMLWYFICLESSKEEIVRSEPPGFKSTDPGGDSLIIHRISDGNLLFRLWEMKKYAPKKEKGGLSVTPTVRKAFKQIDAKALEYLARYTVIGQEIGDEELSNFYGQLVDLWISASPQAAAGVSVATSKTFVSEDCFSEFEKYFPRLVKPNRLRGMLSAVENFSGFVREVQEQVWKGL